jgi:hypothetical protein
MNAEHEEAVEFAKVSKRENRVYVGNLSYEVKYRDLMEFMRGGGWGNPRLVFRIFPFGGLVEGGFIRISSQRGMNRLVGRVVEVFEEDGVFPVF